MTDDLWTRFIDLQAGNIHITSDQLDIEFEVKGSNSSSANTAEITVYNLSSATKAAIKPGQKIRLKAGHVGNYGEIFTGIVKATFDDRDAGNTQDLGDIPTKITAVNQVYTTGLPPVSYPKGTPFSTIILAAFTASDIPVEKIDDQGFVLEEDYTSDPSALTNLQHCQRKINGDSSKTHKTATFYVETEKGYFVTTEFVSQTERVVVSSGTGLTQTVPEEPDDGSYTRSITSLLNWRVTADALVELKSRAIGASGSYKVVEYTHSCDSSDYQTVMKVKPI